MTIICCPKGRGNWRLITLKVDAPADLFPALRDRAVSPGMVISFAGLTLRIVEVRP